MGNLWNNLYSQYQANQQAKQQALAEQAEKERLAALSKKNNATRGDEAARQRQGYTTKGWTDPYTGEYLYSITGKKKESSGSRKSGGSSKSDGDSEKPVQDIVTPVTYDYAYRNALANMYGNSAYGIKTNGASDALAYLKNLNTSGRLSEKDTESIIEKLKLK